MRNPILCTQLMFNTVRSPVALSADIQQIIVRDKGEALYLRTRMNVIRLLHQTAGIHHEGLHCTLQHIICRINMLRIGEIALQHMRENICNSCRCLIGRKRSGILRIHDCEFRDDAIVLNAAFVQPIGNDGTVGALGAARRYGGDNTNRYSRFRNSSIFEEVPYIMLIGYSCCHCLCCIDRAASTHGKYEINLFFLSQCDQLTYKLDFRIRNNTALFIEGDATLNTSLTNSIPDS